MSGEDRRPSYGASVVIDIGGDIGAVVLNTPDWLAGDEIEIRQKDKREASTHTAVRARCLGHSVTFAAVFPAVGAGDYTLHSMKDPAPEA
jgi:hypothetical protein